MKSSKGFTLVELLAVIVILAIILAIAIPSITNVVNSSRLSSFAVSSDMLERAAKTYLSVNNTSVASGTTSYILYSDMKTAGYINKVVDPTSKNECTHSGVYVTNNSGTYTYKGALACDNYMNIDSYNLVTNSDFSSGTTGWAVASGNLSVNNNILVNTASGANYYNHSIQYTNFPIVTGDKIYLYTRIRVTNNLCNSFYISIRGSNNLGSYSTISQNNPTINGWYVLTGIVSIASDSTGNISFYVTQTYPDATTASGKIIQVDGTYGVYAIDLTAIYGTGNEPNVTQMNTIMTNMGK